MSKLQQYIASGALAALSISVLPAAAAAQQPDREVSVMVGGFSYDYGGDKMFPAAALTLNQRMSRHLVAEVALSYSRVDVTLVDNGGPEPTSREARSNLGAATAGVQAEWPLGPARPYIGVSTGVFGRFDPEGGDRFFRTTTAIPVGVRVQLTERLGARGEVRARFDEHQSGGSSADAELMIGFGWSF